MVLGVGIDIEAVDFFKKRSFNSHKAFYRRVFSKSEIDYCLKKAKPHEHFAARFCAKEAAVKAFADLDQMPISSFEIRANHQTKKPTLVLTSKKFAQKYKYLTFHLSMSHSHDYACAQVVLEQRGLK